MRQMIEDARLAGDAVVQRVGEDGLQAAAAAAAAASAGAGTSAGSPGDQPPRTVTWEQVSERSCSSVCPWLSLALGAAAVQGRDLGKYRADLLRGPSGCRGHTKRARRARDLD